MSEHNYTTRKPKIHNPKSFAPAVYIPAWLSQVPSKELPYSCKLVYGRLAQWANAKGKAYRSAKNLSCELGIPQRTIEHSIDKLKKCGLIGSFQPYEGGKSHYQFYDHEWMYRPLDKNLCYESDDVSPSANIAEPSANIAEPSANIAEHKIKRNKKENNNIAASSDEEATHSDETKEVQMVIAVWNAYCESVGCPKVGRDKRQIQAIRRNIKAIKKSWEVTFSPETFEILLQHAIERQFYLLVKFQRSLDVFLRWKNFKEACDLVEGDLR